ncbi:methylated-DNA--[protein]-cysteine S-methyltransferase [Paenibacillus sp. LMG 31456]|uniref:methylated-DNA--[protein]-cysteine S-methyltransferase n=1 Tax=Paenibacillus foliorum TaxID=2654974 RepID=A0A972K634_9BACL|nr:methylated-DNA--[protein]-cysteine S-methyltransferase [Paenibacillus foliorum]NOU97717.1 methylated-DNA--[protein]-cysteine S-methyltransferase [Paenibacillus foliorum]
MEAKTYEAIYWTLLVHETWSLYIASTSKGLCYVGSPNKPFEELSNWAAGRFPGKVLIHDDTKLHSYTAELSEYFQGKRRAFTVPIDFHGTSFQLAVWNALCKIPYGQTQSYSDIANHIQKPAAVRAVGAAIGANPVLITVPCHRVIGKDGSLTGYRGGLEMKTQLLKLEHDSSLVVGGSPVHA